MLLAKMTNKTGAENDLTARLYGQRYFQEIRRSNPNDFVLALHDLAKNESVSPLLAPFTRKLDPVELRGSPLDPTGPAAEVFKPRELSSFLDQLRRKAELFTLWVGRSANDTALGKIDLVNSAILGDLDFTVLSSNPKMIIYSPETLIERLKVSTTSWNRGKKRSFSEVVEEFSFLAEASSNPFRIAFLKTSSSKFSRVIGTTIYQRQSSGLPNKHEVLENSIADVGYASADSVWNRLKDMAFLYPREDSLALFLVPTPGKEFPFVVWLIDPQKAIDKAFDGEMIIYPPNSAILKATDQKGYRGVLAASESIIRGERLALRIGKKIPRDRFYAAALNLRRVADRHSPTDSSAKERTSVKLEQISGKVALMISEFPRFSAAFLAGDIGTNLFPRIAQVLDSLLPDSRNIRQTFETLDIFPNKPEIQLSDIVVFLTNRARSVGLPVWSESRDSSWYMPTQSPFARNLLSPFRPANDLRYEPRGADMSPLHRRLVDVSLARALKRLRGS